MAKPSEHPSVDMEERIDAEVRARLPNHRFLLYQARSQLTFNRRSAHLALTIAVLDHLSLVEASRHLPTTTPLTEYSLPYRKHTASANMKVPKPEPFWQNTPDDRGAGLFVSDPAQSR